MKQIAIFLLMIVCCKSASSDTFYVSTQSPADGPGTAWSNAFHVIQDAVDAAATNDTVWVTNGIYNVGGAVTPGYASTNRVCITNAITVQSVNGAAETIIDGAGSARCVYLTTGAVLSGFSLTNGAALTGDELYYDLSGGGALLTGGTMNDCILIGNRAEFGGGAELYTGGTLNNCKLIENTTKYDGGGASLDEGGTMNNCLLSGNVAEDSGGGVELYSDSGYSGELNNCILSGNTATIYGGGADLWGGGILNNCTLSGNFSGEDGGGAYLHDGGTLNNCIVWDNETVSFGNDIYDDSGDAIRATCASGGLTNGVDGCITNAPLFINGTYRLGYGSPCIDTGTNIYAAGSLDIDGNARIVNTTVDMGAYEYAAELYDTDGDNFTDADELIADTDPADTGDFFRITGIDFPASISFQSSDARQYTLQARVNLLEGNWVDVPGRTNLTGTGEQMILIDSASNSSCFYRVQVDLP